ncbi:hypothetical protein [Xanthocytophaga agilis]|uniref:Uncharacterized protein n=1 Tax=Xanthocytophaga agilis TaxID=3048010 RepID=A0AAE3RBD0_9BACT|nr:hypothetical protein [Xanthocytophaga agilis]MDJ1505077.1 hypothetical protein [Xanthocytophaga agilis]
MKKLQYLLTNAIFASALLLVPFSAFAQDELKTQQPAQAAQIGDVEMLPEVSKSKTTEKVVDHSTQNTTQKTIRLVAPENATPKQARRIAKANEMLAKLSKQPTSTEVKAPSKLQKMAAQMAVKKLTKKLDKLGVEETKEIREIKSASAAQAVSNTVLIGIILLALGIIFLVVPGTGLLGLILLIVGLVLLILGLAQ